MPIVFGLSALLACPAAAQPPAPLESITDVPDFETLREEAHRLALEPFEEPPAALPDWLAGIGYDAYRDIHFRDDRWLWAEDVPGFRVAFFHPGYIYPRQLRLWAVEAEAAREVVFDPSYFRYTRDPTLPERLPPGLGFPGFRVFETITGAEPSPLFSFLGASYFRARTRDLGYGLSARGIAIHMGTSESEEFPDFTAFWLQRPAQGDETLTFFALLDGPSVTGAYAFTVRPGETTSVHVRASITLRDTVASLGLAPFSSMFWYGENTLRKPPDFRPEVHDSDGLWMETEDGEHVWRPLTNPLRTRTDKLPATHLRSFGLLQRDRDFAHYQDIDAHYHQRPDAWVEPGPELIAQEGRLHLLEIETPHEYADNIALAWVPEEPPLPGERFDFSYTVHFGTLPAAEIGRVVATRLGESIHAPEQLEFVIDFEGGSLADFEEGDAVRAELAAEGSRIRWRLVRRNPHSAGWRLVFRTEMPAGSEGARFKARLTHRGERLTETWTYWWQP